ncbi:MAG: hypothetical protein QOE41_1795 [Mycobacterium sp.]|nr:hypothetical protein [Mycobacterium sp.]
MNAALRICGCRGAAVVLASGAAISLTALTGGMGPALADPVTQTSAPTTAAIAPSAAVAPRQTVSDIPAPPSVAPVVPQAPATVEAPPQTQATKAPPPPPEPTTQAPIVTREPEIATTTAAAPITTPPAAVTTTADAPITTPPAAVTTTAPSLATSEHVTTTAPVTTSAAATTTSRSASSSVTAGLAPSSTASSTGTSKTPPEGSTPTSPTAATGTTATGHTGTATTAPGAVSSTPSTPAQAGQVIKTAVPDTLQADPQNVQVAKAAIPVDVNPDPASPGELSHIKDLLANPTNPPGVNPPPNLAAEGAGAGFEGKVKQWQPEWVQYDDYYRPVIFNPYPEPLQLVYLYGGVPRIFTIPALASNVLDVPELGAYNFTAMLLNAVGIPTNVAVGSFFGGGYFPGPGLPPPPPPPPVVRYDDVPVVVKYTNAEYKPFRVNRIVDVGDDAREGERKVLIDGVTPAWGVWKQTEIGERQFEVHKTQQFPGMSDPQEGPLPGNYQLQLASASHSSGLSTKDVLLIVAAGVVATLGLGAIVLTTFLGRRRRRH